MRNRFRASTIAQVAESKIQEAIDEGEFDNLPGFGKPFEFDPFSHDPNWWIKEKMERERIAKLVKEQKARANKRKTKTGNVEQESSQR